MLLCSPHPNRLPRGPDGCGHDRTTTTTHRAPHEIAEDTMRTYEITRTDLTRTLHVHTDGRVVEEIPGHDFPEGYLPDSKVVGHIERRIKPGTRTSRQYRAIDEKQRPGLWHSSLQRAVEDVEYFTRSQHLAETRCELVDRYIASQPSGLNGATYYVARTVDGRMIGPMTGGIEFARAVVRHHIEQGDELLVPFPAPEVEAEEQCPGSPYCNCGEDSEPSIEERRKGTLTVSASALSVEENDEGLIEAAKLAAKHRSDRSVDVFRFNGRLYLIVDMPAPEYGQSVTLAGTRGQQQLVPTINLRTLLVAAELDDDEPQLARDVDTGQVVGLNLQPGAHVEVTGIGSIRYRGEIIEHDHDDALVLVDGGAREWVPLDAVRPLDEAETERRQLARAALDDRFDC